MNNYDMSYLEEKPLTKQYGDTICFNSDEGSNSLDCSDFGWVDFNVNTPEISSLLDEAQFVEIFPSLIDFLTLRLSFFFPHPTSTLNFCEPYLGK